MQQPKIQPSDGLSFRTCSVFIFMVLQSVGEQAELICSHQPIVALAGDDVILPCHLEAPTDVSSETVVWIRPDLDQCIHYHQDGRLISENQNPSYHLRTRLFVDELENGNVSMKIFRVKLSDAGKYECHLQSMMKHASIQLTVGVVSTPVTKSGSFTHGVQQKNIKQTRETHFCVPDHFFPVPSLFWTTINSIVITIFIGGIVALLAYNCARPGQEGGLRGYNN